MKQRIKAKRKGKEPIQNMLREAQKMKNNKKNIFLVSMPKLPRYELKHRLKANMKKVLDLLRVQGEKSAERNGTVLFGVLEDQPTFKGLVRAKVNKGVVVIPEQEGGSSLCNGLSSPSPTHHAISRTVQEWCRPGSVETRANDDP